MFEGGGDIDPEGQDDDPLSRELAHIDAIINRSRRVLDAVVEGPLSGSSERPSLVVGGLIIRDYDWDERELMAQWRAVLKKTEGLPPVLSAAILFDACETIVPLQRHHPLGGQLVAAYLRACGKVTSHLPGFHIGLKAIPREHRRAQGRTTRLLTFLDAMSAAAEAGMKEIARLSQAREQMERKVRGGAVIKQPARGDQSAPCATDCVCFHDCEGR
ncbi:DUF1612 domain-containing protein [Castellaniella sp.]|uniref:DUF1612 domain-containing protein n=1 Tax=Castellaniella sp. TaxID=1955812 RepID=UPI002AFF6F70|nr:DUF1612 domain-containing protein [Castellaniella sp.]